jgi:hypothetical protein
MAMDWPTECDEVAANMQPPHFASFDAAAAWVRTRMMPDESYQIIDNIAEALWHRQKRAERRPMARGGWI